MIRGHVLSAGRLTTSTAAQVLISDNPSRAHLIIRNDDGTNKVALGFGSTVTATNGFVLGIGSVLELPGYCGPIQAIALAGTPLITYLEY
jgi:hypothetical protein